jgi:predicted dehydrogenase
MDKLSLAVIGCGRIARKHLEGIARLRDSIELVAVADVLPERADDFRRQYGAGKAYCSIGDVVADREIAAVVLCLPHHLHHPVAVACMRGGKHVLVEKVMSTSYQDSLDMVHEAQKNGVTLMVGYNRRFTQAVGESISRVRAGGIGDVYNVIATWQVGFAEPPTPWWTDRDKTGGLLMTLLGSHVIDYINWLMDYRLPVRVYCQNNRINPLWDGEDESTMLMTYRDGATATLHLSFNAHGRSHYSRLIQGKKATLLLENDTQLSLNGEVVVAGSLAQDMFMLQAEEFASSIGENREPLTSGRFVAPVNAVIDAAFLSARTDQAVDMRAMYPSLDMF